MEQEERLKRKADDFLIQWKQTPGHMPLIVKGARQIGKTKAIEHFAKNHYPYVVEINFALQKKYKDIFDDGFEVDTIIRNISLKDPSLEFIPGQTLIFLMSCRTASIVLLRSNPSVRMAVTM